MTIDHRLASGDRMPDRGKSYRELDTLDERAINRLAAIVEFSEDAILGMTMEGIITEWNHGASELYGYSADEAIGRSVTFLIPPSHRGELDRIMDTIRKGGRIKHMDTVRLRKDGSQVTVSLTASPIKDHTGQITGVSWIARDITNRKKIEEELASAKNQVELYLDLLGHDINNMNQIAMGFLEVALESFELDDEEREFLEKPLEALKNSAKLIENVRKLQKLEEGGLKYWKVDLCDILSEVIANNSHIPGRSVTINYQPLPGCYIMANELIGDVFSNLINNSIKHSESQQPLTINIGLEQVTEKGADYYRVTVEDDGPGIPDDLKNRLFMRFQRGQTKTIGKGLGLYLVRTLVNDFQGKIWVEDRVSGDHTKGARFVVMLPAVEK